MSSRIYGIAIEVEEAYRKNKAVALKKHLKTLSKAVADLEAAEPQAERYRAAAKTKLHNEGTLEVDDDAVVSISKDDGAYVQAWVWIPDSLLPNQDGTSGQDR